MKKLAVIAGARPQFVKLAPLVEVLQDRSKLIVINTGQHYDYEMSDIFFKQLKIPEVNYHLGIGSAGHATQVGKMMIELEKVYHSENPDMVVIIGDTNSTLAGAVSAAKNNIPVAHVEAGLRSKDNSLPEQINRIVADRLSSVLCCPDKASMENLKGEGIAEGVFLTGDILYDLVKKITPDDDFCARLLKQHNLEKNNYIMMTMHRAENVDNPGFLRSIIDGLSTITNKIIMPLHPRTAKNLKKFNLYNDMLKIKDIKVIKPVGIIESLALVKSSLGVITDSGGIQREAAYFGRKAYILRDETEWVELERYGAVECIGSKITQQSLDWTPAEIPDEYFADSSKFIANCVLNFL